MRPDTAAPVEQHRLPPDDTLLDRLTLALGGDGGGVALEIVDRRRVGHYATFPNEVVTIALEGKLRRVFCKYEDRRAHPVFGHRSGLAYEAAVYREVLAPMRTRTVGYLGDHVDHGSGDTWLFLDYVDGAVPYAWRPRARNLTAAVRWLARFHADAERLLGERELSFLTRYDRAYFIGWAERTLEFTAPLRRAHPWLDDVCAGFGELVDVLLDAPMAVVHGEYYTKNVLLKNGTVFPIDWESAAVGPGEIDLATAGDGRWNPDVVDKGDTEYARARWPDGPPHDFSHRLAVARLYTQLRWLGDRPEWTLGPKVRWRFRYAERAARDLGLL